MHHPVSGGVDVSQAPYLIDPGAIRGQPAQHVIERRGDIADGRGQLLARTRAVLGGEDGFAANSLYLPTTQKLIVVLPYALQVCGNQLKLQTGTACVDDEDVHGVSL